MAYRVDSDIFDFESLYIVVLIAVLTKNKGTYIPVYTTNQN